MKKLGREEDRVRKLKIDEKKTENEVKQSLQFCLTI